MSGIFGIFNRNNQPVDKTKVQTMRDAISYWNPDEVGEWTNGSIALGYAMLWNTPESKYEHLPLSKELYVLTMDARIDNREQLARELDLPNRPMEKIGDSEFILAAYAKWGEACPKYLLGDFAFAIWDKTKQQLFCARDHVGIKPFYYYLSDDIFVFGNDIEGVLAHSDVPKNFDDETVATFLKNEGIHTQRNTFFKKLKKLPPASLLMVSSSSVVEKQYWDIEKSPPILYDTYDEYVQRLKVLLDEAVEARLRTSFPMASHLSGGIDSSPIAVLAARKLKKRKQKLYVFNWINIPKIDEYEYEAWSFSRRIAQTEGMEHKEFTIDPHFIANLYEAHNFMTRGNMYYWEEYAVQDMASKMHVRTILSGWGGDELISHSGASYILDLFSKRKFVEMFKRLLYEKKYLNYSWYRFVRRVLGVILPSALVKRLKNQLEYDDYGSEFYTHYVTKEFAQYMHTHTVKPFTTETEVRKKQLGMYNYGHLQDRIESWALAAYPKKIEYRYPLLDKRIVEFAIGIPEKMFYPNKGIARHLMKNTIADLLPSDIVWFPKVDEVKIGDEGQKQFVATLKLLQERYREENDTHDNAYVEYDKIKVLLQTFDFDDFDSSLSIAKNEQYFIPLIAIATVMQLVKSIEKIKHFSTEWYN